MTGKDLLKFCFSLIAASAIVWLAACDNEHNVNVGNLVTVEGFVFQSRTNRIGVADVLVIIEAGEEASSFVSDVFVRTDENGHWQARFTLGYTDGGGVMNITPQYQEGNMRIIMYSSEYRIFDLGFGYSFQVGKTYKVEEVFLEDFTTMETAE